MPEYFVRVLEGIDGSGKTTAGQMIAAQSDGRYLYCTEGNPLRPYRKFFDTKPLPVRFLYYLMVPLINYSRIEEMRKSSDVFVDRSIASTIAYHKAMGLSDGWFNLIPNRLINQVDTMLYFWVSEEERLRRLGNRKTNAETMTFSDDRSRVLGYRIDHEYRKIFTDRTLFINGDNKSPQQVTDEVIERLYGEKNR